MFLASYRVRRSSDRLSIVKGGREIIALLGGTVFGVEIVSRVDFLYFYLGLWLRRSL
jgi:type IV secretory pathway TrbD component